MAREGVDQLWGPAYRTVGTGPLVQCAGAGHLNHSTIQLSAVPDCPSEPFSTVPMGTV